MKQVKSLLAKVTAAALAAAGALMPVHAQTWQTLYDAPGHVFSALFDPFPNHPQPGLFLGGMSSRTPASNPFSVEWVGPLDGVTSPAAVVSDTDPSSCNQLGFDSWSGRLYSAGNGALGWQVRESADEGGSWMTVDAPYASGSASGFASDGQGRVFVCGTANGHWIVRQRNSNGWSTIQDWSASKKSYSAFKVHIASGFLFVVGQADNLWAVQRLNLANNTWSTPYTGAPQGKHTAGAVAVTSSGTDLYVLAWAGGVFEAPEQCVLLKGAKLGAGPWTTVRTFAESTYFNRPWDLGFDTAGNLYVTGHSSFYTTAGTWNEAWIVRRYTAATGVWNWSLPLGYPGNQRSFARQVAIDPASGAVFITGTACTVPSSEYRAIVQKWVP